MYNMMQPNNNQMPQQNSFNGMAWRPNSQPGMVSFPDMNMTGMNNYGMMPMQHQPQQQQQQQQQPFYNMNPMGMPRGGQQDMASYMMNPMQPCIVVNGQPQPIVGPPREQNFGGPPREMMMWP